MATRREFIKKAGFATVFGIGYGVFAGKPVFGLTPNEGNLVSINRMTLNTFSPHIDTVFYMKPTSSGKPADLVLVQTKDLSNSFNMESELITNSFSVLFKADRPVDFVSQQVELRHKDLGRFRVFMTPVLSEGKDFEVIFCNFN